MAPRPYTNPVFNFPGKRRKSHLLMTEPHRRERDKEVSFHLRPGLAIKLAASVAGSIIYWDIIIIEKLFLIFRNGDFPPGGFTDWIFIRSEEYFSTADTAVFSGVLLVIVIPPLVFAPPHRFFAMIRLFENSAFSSIFWEEEGRRHIQLQNMKQVFTIPKCRYKMSFIFLAPTEIKKPSVRSLALKAQYSAHILRAHNTDNGRSSLWRAAEVRKIAPVRPEHYIRPVASSS